MQDLRDKAFASVRVLAERYLQYETQYRSSSYLESQVRLDFLDEFWVALGWDVRHTQQFNPYRQEVRVEKSQDVGEQGRKRPDYTFYLEPEFRDPKFIVEAKRPGVALTDPDPLLQAIRYGWNAGLSVVVLHNFAEFVIVDTRSRPDPRTAQSKVLLNLSILQLRDQEHFDKVFYLFSRPAVADGALLRFSQSLPTPRRAPRKRELFDRPEKIVVQEIRNISLARRIVATLDTSRTFCLQSTNVIGLKDGADVDLYFLLGVINTNLVNHYFRLKFPANNHIASNQLAAIPIPTAKPADQSRVRKLVEAIIKANEELRATEAPLQRETMLARVLAIDTQIERIVCGLYGVPADLVPAP